MTPRETLYTQREAARTKKSLRSRRGVNGENVDHMKLLKDPLIVVTGGELVGTAAALVLLRADLEDWLLLH